ncbi:MAG: ABC transporter permease [Anaerolineae bacterium]|nr:ABC transporter permease [Anaerolineae bacterium]
MDKQRSDHQVGEKEPPLQRFKRFISERPEIILSPLIFIIFILGWEWLVKVFEIKRILLPPPSDVVRALIRSFVEGDLIRHFGVTLYETIVGFFIGSILGLLLGALVSQFRIVEKTLYPYIVAFQTLPKVAIAPLIVVWFGYGYSSKIVITALIAFFPLLVNTIAGLHSTSPEYIEMLTAFTASKWQIFRMVKVPTALPFIFAGLDVAGILSVIGAIVGEFVGARAGLGYMILYRNFQLDTPGVFAILIVLSLLGIGVHVVINAIQSKVVFWTKPETERVIGA